MKIIKNIRKFFYNTYLELKKVSWLSKKDTIKYSLFVVIFIVSATLYILGLDRAFAELRSALIFQSI